MRHYEIMLLVHPEHSDQVPETIAHYQNMITSENGLIHRVEDWGRRRLAYSIKNVHKAHYVLWNIECGLATLQNLEKLFRFNDAILRYLVIRRSDALTEETKEYTAKCLEREKEGAVASKQESDSTEKATTEGSSKLSDVKEGN